MPQVVLDPAVVSQLVGRRRQDGDPLGQLTGWERELLALIGDGRSGKASAASCIAVSG